MWVLVSLLVWVLVWYWEPPAPRFIAGVASWGWGRAPPGGEEERRQSNKHSRHPGDRASGSPVLPPGSHSQFYQGLSIATYQHQGLSTSTSARVSILSHSQGVLSQHLARAAIRSGRQHCASPQIKKSNSTCEAGI